jgi:NNP family nitrate/nitrite transporter-like MFS transporter
VVRSRALELARAAGQELFPGGSVREGLWVTARMLQTWLLVALYFTSFGGFLALTAWLPTYWADRFGLGLAAAGGLTMVYSVLASVVRVAGGILSDRLGGERTSALGFVVMAAGAAAMGVAASVPFAVAGCIVMALGMGTANAAIFKMVPGYLALGGGAAGAGWVGGLGAFGGFVLPPILGALVGRFGSEVGYALGYDMFALLALLSVGLTGVLALRWGVMARVPVQLATVHCPTHGTSAEVWAQAPGGEIAPVRLVRCSLLPGEIGGVSCQATCMEQVCELIAVQPPLSALPSLHPKTGRART